MNHHLAERLESYIKSANCISQLNLYCQKFNKPAPVWNVITQFENNVQLQHITLHLLGETFELRNGINKQDCKKAVASFAVEFFRKNGITWFNEEYRNTPGWLNHFCQLAGMPAPVFEFIGNLSHIATVNCCGTLFESTRAYGKKSEAKGDVAKSAFEYLCKDKGLVNRIITSNPTLGAKLDVPEVIHVQGTQRENVNLKDVALSIKEAAPDYVQLLNEYCEENQSIGKPFYNSRTTTDENGTVYRSQLIVGSNSKVSSAHPTKSEANNEVAKQMLDLLHSEGADALVSAIQRKRKREIDDDGVYCSDDEGQIPSYEMLVRETLRLDNLPPPTFSYSYGLCGFICTGSIENKSKQLETFVSFREHSRKSTAREDVCHDLYLFMKTREV